MKKSFVFFPFLLLFTHSLVFSQQLKIDLQAVVWASSCMACHGTDGKAEGVGLTIGGHKADELYRELLEYKSGKRLGTIMQQHAKGYSDDELKRIALFFSQIK
ncbi:MAG: class I cytochrome c [Burkholderiaceae bacterium]